MADLIGAPESVDEQNREYAALLKAVHGKGERPFQLATANALWGQEGCRFNPDFKKTMAEFYDGAFKEAGFHGLPDEAVKTINAWVSEKTGGKINGLIQRNVIDGSTRLILTNAVYFKGKWDAEFSKASTSNEDWHGPGGGRKVPMMQQKRAFPYYHADDFQALDLPYAGEQLSMLVVLPKKHDGLPVLEAKWAAKGMYRAVTSMLRREEAINVSFPRFKMEAAFTLKQALCVLGAELAFSDNADFSGIGEERLRISEVIHKAFVEVNEEGTEAAAASGVVMAKCASVRPTQPIVFNADHPFLFFIRDRNTQAALFTGRMMDPW